MDGTPSSPDSVQLDHNLPIEPEELMGLMETDTDRLVVLDVRPYSDYVVGHIKNAFTLRFSSILLRRLRQNKVSVLDLLIDEASQCIFRERTSRPHAVIVVYDNNTTELDISEPDHRNSLHVTVQHLLNSNYHVRFLRGGFNGFQDMVDFCEANPNNTPPQAALSLSSLSLDRNMTPSTPIERHHRDKAPAQILPYLYVGAEAHAENRELLKRLNVTHVLNLTTHDSRKYPEFGYHQIAIRDSWNQDMSKCFEDAFEYINKCRAEGGCVLLHCVAGISRSATVAIAYLMTFRELDLNAAYSTVKERRPCIAPNLDFMGELQRYEEKLAAKRQVKPSGWTCVDEESQNIGIQLPTFKGVIPPHKKNRMNKKGPGLSLPGAASPSAHATNKNNMSTSQSASNFPSSDVGPLGNFGVPPTPTAAAPPTLTFPSS